MVELVSFELEPRSVGNHSRACNLWGCPRSLDFLSLSFLEDPGVGSLAQLQPHPLSLFIVCFVSHLHTRQ